MNAVPDSPERSSGPVVPSKPDVVLRVGFAGARQVPQSDGGRAQAALASVFEVLEERVMAIHATINDPGAPEHPLTRFHSDKAPPLIRLVNGLAEGGDELASKAFFGVAESEVRRELGGILPFSVERYRESRREGDAQAQAFLENALDARLKSASYVIELDGVYERYQEPTPKEQSAGVKARDAQANRGAKAARVNAYRAQSQYLLRQSDLLVALDDPWRPGLEGGTKETIQRALDFKLPVVFVDAISGKARILRPDDPSSDIQDGHEGGDLGAEETKRALAQLLNEVLLGPLVKVLGSQDREAVESLPEIPEEGCVPQQFEERLSQAEGGHGAHRAALNTEVIDELLAQESVALDSEGAAIVSQRERCWNAFIGLFKKKESCAIQEEELAVYKNYRSRSTRLNYHYVGKYRGAVVINYFLAVIAVFLAALSLTLMGVSGESHAGDDHKAPTHDEATVSAVEDAPVESHEDPHHPEDAHKKGPVVDALWATLLALGLLKILCVIGIYHNTRIANREEWNDRAIDFRYLAERLRSVYYLARVGSFQPPAAFGEIASRWMRQSPIDWFFDAIVRHASPMNVSPYCQQKQEGEGPCTIAIDNQDALDVLQKNWLGRQLHYNAEHALRWTHASHRMERWVGVSSFVVIAVVAVDILIAILYALHVPTFVGLHHYLTPWLIFSATVLPAFIATVNGLISKTEAPRFADRHRVMVGRVRERREEVFKLRAEILAETEEGIARARNADVLLLAEVIAQDFINEVADWSVIYDKEVPEL